MKTRTHYKFKIPFNIIPLIITTLSTYVDLYRYYLPEYTKDSNANKCQLITTLFLF